MNYKQSLGLWDDQNESDSLFKNNQTHKVNKMDSSLNIGALNYQSHQFQNKVDKNKENLIVSLLLGQFETLEDLIMFLVNKIEQKNLALDHFKEKSCLLETNLENNKIFLNMVVHDMRNPTNQIDFTLQQSLEQLTGLKEELEKLDLSLRKLDSEKFMNE